MPSDRPLLSIRNLGKNFRLYRRSRDRLLELLTGRKTHKSFAALRDISFDLAPGRIMGIIGENGSGKSTLLKLIAGVLIPDSGNIERNGKITGLLELGTGFNVHLSGRRNIYLNGLYLHLDRRELAEREERIIEFSGLGEFIDEPLKSYSSGMAMRLAFAIAIHADPQCFIIDEALSVGDMRFQQKCFERLQKFKNAGGSILFVSHDITAVKMLCDQAMLLDHGRIRFLGDPEEAVNQLNEIMAEKGASGQNIPSGYGNGAVYFTSARAIGKLGQPVSAVTCGQPMGIQFSYGCNQPARDVTFGITLRNSFGQDVFGINTALLRNTLDIDKPGTACFKFAHMNLAPGFYSINLAAHTGITHLENCFHWWDHAADFEVLPDPNFTFIGHTRLDTTIDYAMPHEQI